VAGDDQSVVLEAPVHRARGVDVDPGGPGELADAGKSVTRSQLTAGDQDPKPPSELRADRKIVRAGEAERRVRSLLLGG
jgi:hypothetical protein